jgi:DNA-binding beta-propeller fold protein YncE
MRPKSSVRAGVVVLCIAAILLPPSVHASTGDLRQLKGASGCINDDALTGCADGRALTNANGVAVSPDGMSVYVASFTSHAVAIFDRVLSGERYGKLKQKPGTAGCISLSGDPGCATGVALLGAASIVVSPDGKNVYVAAFGGHAIAIFDRDTSGGPTHGELTQKAIPDGCVALSNASCNPAVAISGPISVAVSPNGASVYVASPGSDSLTTFDRAVDGTLTQKAGPDGCTTEVLVAGCTDGKALNGAQSVAVSPNGGSVYVASADSDGIAIFDRAADGVVTQKSGLDGCVTDDGSAATCVDGLGLNSSSSVAVSPDGRHVYATSTFVSTVTIFNRTNGGVDNGKLVQKSGATGCFADNPGVATGCADGKGLGSAVGVTVSSDGKSVYVAGLQGAMGIFDRDVGGLLTQSTGKDGCFSTNGSSGECKKARGIAGAAWIALSPIGRSLYVASYTGNGVAAFARSGKAPACNLAVPTLVGTAGGETITGTAGEDIVFGLGGGDEILGGAGNDLLCGGDENDTLKGQGGNDTLHGEDEIDVCVGGPGRDKAPNCETKTSVP